MTSPAQKVAGRIAVGILLVVLAAGSVLATAATLPATAGPTLAEPAATSSPKAEKSPKPDKSPDTDEADDADKAGDPDKADDADGTPSAANLARIVERQAAAKITTTATELAALAANVGVGGAVRVLRLAKASGKTPADILALFESGKGWGVIVRELKLDIGPGGGSVMGTGGGHDKARKAADRAARAQAKAARVAARAARAAERARQGAGSGD